MPSMILTMLQTSFIGIILRHICSPVNLLHNFGTPFYRNTYGRLPHSPGDVP